MRLDGISRWSCCKVDTALRVELQKLGPITAARHQIMNSLGVFVANNQLLEIWASVTSLSLFTSCPYSVGYLQRRGIRINKSCIVPSFRICINTPPRPLLTNIREAYRKPERQQRFLEAWGSRSYFIWKKYFN